MEAIYLHPGVSTLGRRDLGIGDGNCYDMNFEETFLRQGVSIPEYRELGMEDWDCYRTEIEGNFPPNTSEAK